jgi:hypothetical protein
MSNSNSGRIVLFNPIGERTGGARNRLARVAVSWEGWIAASRVPPHGLPSPL